MSHICTHMQDDSAHICTVKESSTFPSDPITLSENDWGVQSPPQQGI